MAVFTKEMDPELKTSRRFRIPLEMRPRKRSRFRIRVMCEYCYELVEVSDTDEMAVCDTCRRRLAKLD